MAMSYTFQQGLDFSPEELENITIPSPKSHRYPSTYSVQSSKANSNFGFHRETGSTFNRPTESDSFVSSVFLNRNEGPMYENNNKCHHIDEHKNNHIQSLHSSIQNENREFKENSRHRMKSSRPVRDDMSSMYSKSILDHKENRNNNINVLNMKKSQPVRDDMRSMYSKSILDHKDNRNGNMNAVNHAFHHNGTEASDSLRYGIKSSRELRDDNSSNFYSQRHSSHLKVKDLNQFESPPTSSQKVRDRSRRRSSSRTKSSKIAESDTLSESRNGYDRLSNSTFTSRDRSKSIVRNHSRQTGYASVRDQIKRSERPNRSSRDRSRRTERSLSNPRQRYTQRSLSSNRQRISKTDKDHTLRTNHSIHSIRNRNSSQDQLNHVPSRSHAYNSKSTIDCSTPFRQEDFSLHDIRESISNESRDSSPRYRRRSKSRSKSKVRNSTRENVGRDHSVLKGAEMMKSYLIAGNSKTPGESNLGEQSKIQYSESSNDESMIISKKSNKNNPLEDLNDLEDALMNHGSSSSSFSIEDVKERRRRKQIEEVILQENMNKKLQEYMMMREEQNLQEQRRQLECEREELRKEREKFKNLRIGGSNSDKEFSVISSMSSATQNSGASLCTKESFIPSAQTSMKVMQQEAPPMAHPNNSYSSQINCESMPKETKTKKPPFLKRFPSPMRRNPTPQRTNGEKPKTILKSIRKRINNLTPLRGRGRSQSPFRTVERKPIIDRARSRERKPRSPSPGCQRKRSTNAKLDGGNHTRQRSPSPAPKPVEIAKTHHRSTSNNTFFSVNNIMSSSTDDYEKDPAYIQARDSGLLWQTLVREFVRFPSKWFAHGRIPLMGLNEDENASWKYVARFLVRGNDQLESITANKKNYGRILLHIVLLDTATWSVSQDIAIGCFQPHAEGIKEKLPLNSDSFSEDARVVWMAVRRTNQHESNVFIDDFLFQGMSIDRISQSSPLGERRFINNKNIRMVSDTLELYRGLKSK